MKVNEIIEESIKLEQTMPDKLGDPDGLSFAISKQGNFRSLLGSSLAKLEKEAAELKAHLKFTEASMKKDLVTGSDKKSGMPVNKAELAIASDKKIEELRHELIQKEYGINLIRIKRDDIKTANDGYRSRLAFIREETH